LSGVHINKGFLFLSHLIAWFEQWCRLLRRKLSNEKVGPHFVTRLKVLVNKTSQPNVAINKFRKNIPEYSQTLYWWDTRLEIISSKNLTYPWIVFETGFDCNISNTPRKNCCSILIQALTIILFSSSCSGWGSLHSQVQGRRRHQQLRRLRGGAAQDFVDGEVRERVCRILKKNISNEK